MLCLLVACLHFVGVRCGEPRHHQRQHRERHGTGRLVRRQQARQTEVTRVALAVTSEGEAEELLPHLWSSIEARSRAEAPVFEPTVRTCSADAVRAFDADQQHFPPADGRTSFRQRSNMRALAEVAGTFRKLGVPVVLLSGMLLGWRRGCFAVPGDADADVGTFGPWLHEVGLARLQEAFGAAGHTLETQYCPDGLLAAGCELRVTLAGLAEAERERGGTPYVDVEVLFSAPPVSVGRLPGRFDKCSVDVCGRRCERCPFAYSLWGNGLASQDRFYACPIPVGRFSLVAWMNQTFWAPHDLEGYLRAEYGHGWRVPAAHGETWPTYRPCQPYMGADMSFSQYPSFIPGLPDAADVLQAQAAAEVREGSKIAAAAGFELELWGEAAPRRGRPPWRRPLEGSAAEKERPRGTAEEKERPKGTAEEKERPEGTSRHAEPPVLWKRLRAIVAAALAVAAVTSCACVGWRCAAGNGSGCTGLLLWLQARRAEPPKT